MEAFRCPRKINREEGICLTWKDVWVAASNRKSGSISILKGLTGYAKSGQLLAIMGPSGCGKSTLAYVTQDDTLLTTLTVREAVHYSQSEKKERADFTIREMGLQDAINTRIGGRGSKGASGGQKDIEVGLLGIEKYPQKKQSASFSIEWKRGHAGFFNQCLVLTERSFANMYRDLGYYWLQFAIFVALAIALATIFCDLGTSYGSVQDPGSLIAFINGFLTFMTIGGFPSFVEVMKNEFEGLRFASNEVGGGYISGEDILRNTWQVDTSYSKWVDLAILIGMIVVYRVLFLVIIKIKEKMKPVVVSLSCMSASSKRTIQVMENPNATPLH
ncbi:ABC transporter G family member 11 [Glycine soja]|uniref:ABC transporter G family member 11 n=1 Tax=Glycine soja TaxID=3848 RepID=A0A0B2P1E8_GLYSO|nr:ABC transporter G family member 11 [Glycine soja]